MVPAAKYQSADAIDAHGPTANWFVDSTPFSTTTSRENASTTTPPAGPSVARPRRVSECGPMTTVCATAAELSSGLNDWLENGRKGGDPKKMAD